MSAERKWVLLEKLCDILDNKRKPITKKDRVAGEYPYYGATGVLDYVDGYIFDEPLILIGEDGAKWGVGENTAYPVKGKCWVNNHAHAIRPHRDKVLDSWIIYYLNATDLSPFVTGLTVPKLNQAKLKSIPIPLPPLEEQKRIVAILDEAFEGIEKAQANAQQNLANARELFESYMNAIFNQANSKYKAARIADICTIRPPKREASQKLKPNDKVSFVAMENLGILAKDLTLNTERSLKDVQGSYTYFAENDVLLAKITPCFENGKLGIARNLTNGIGFGSSEYIVIRSGDNINPDCNYSPPFF